MSKTVNMNTPLEITLSETYSNTDFLAKMISQSSGSTIDKQHVAVAKSLHKRLKGKTVSKVAYTQKAYKIPDGVAYVGRLYPANQRFTCYQNMKGSMRRALIKNRYVEVDMENAHFKLLAGKYPDAVPINDYISSRDSHLESVQSAAGVPRSVAKQLFLILIFGGTIDTWKIENNVSEDVTLPAICGDVYRSIAGVKADIELRPEYKVFAQAAKCKKAKQTWENTAFALWLQDLEAKCMLSAIGYIQSGGVEVASLIHDGALIKATDEHKVDLEELGDHVRESTGLECSFAIKPLDLDDEDKAWIQQVEDGFVDRAKQMREIAEARDDRTALIVEAGIEGGHRLLAEVFHGMFPDILVFLGKTEGWYMFRSPRWVSIAHDVQCIMKLIDGSLYDAVSSTLETLEDEETPNDVEIKAVQGLLKNIAKIPFKKNLVEQLAVSYQVLNPSKWLAKFDSDEYILGFEDCVYDFREKCFRDGRPEDMVSMSVGHTRADMEFHMDGSDESEEIIDSLQSMHESDEVLWYVMKTLATSVVGNRPNDRFQIWSGTGANGKGLTKNLVASAFGDYYYEPSAGLFATRSVSGSVLSSELAKLKGRRICIASEAEPGDKLRAGLLKQCTGHDLIQARDLYKSASEFRCMANIVLCFNEIPGVDDSSGGIERRLDLIRHPFKFVDNPTRPHEKAVDRSLQNKFSSSSYGAAFLGALIKIHIEYGFEFETPESVKQEAKEYLGENDVLGQFLQEYFEETSEYSDYVKLRDIWGQLRSARDYNDQMGINQSQQLSEKLKNKGLIVTKAKGVSVLRYYKVKTTRGTERSSETSGVPV